MFWCTKSIKFHFRWGTKPRDQKQGTGNDCDVNSGLQASRKTDFSDISYFLINNALLYHFLANWLAHNKKMSEARLVHIIICLRALEFKHIQIYTSVCHTLPGCFVRGINDIRIFVRQPYFNVQKTTKRIKFGWRITQQTPDKLQNAKWLFPGRALPKTKHQIYLIILKPNIKFTSLS